MMDKPASHPRSRVTLKDIALHCGVSIGTVSFVLRGDPRFSAATSARVRAAAEALGYDPARHHAARRLVMLGRGQRIINHLAAVLLPAHFTQANYFSQLFQGVAEGLTRAQYGMLMLPMYSGQEASDALPLLPPSFARGDVDGLIAHCPPDRADALLAHLSACCDLATFPIVFLVHDITGYSAVTADDEDGGYQAGAHLLALGHRHLLFLPEMTAWTATAAHRRRGLRRAVVDAGLDPDRHLHEIELVLGSSMPPHHLDPPSSADIAAHPLVGYLRAHPEITAICARNDGAAHRLWYLLTRAGYAVPGDYSLVGFDDVDPLRDDQGHNRLTTVRVPLDALGQAATELLLRQVGADAVVPERITLPTELIVRETTGAPR